MIKSKYVFASGLEIRTLDNDFNSYFQIEYNGDFDAVQDYALLAEDPKGIEE